MPKKIVNIGLVGAGKLGTYHIQKLLNKENCNFVGIYDTEKRIMDNHKSEYGINTFDNLEALFKQSDAIVIATPTTFHYEISKNALSKNLHVFIEKPITDSISDANILKSIAKKNNKIIQVGHVERFNKAFTESLKYIKEPQFIEIHRISPFPNRSLDIPVVMDVMIHDLDILLSINKKNSISKLDASGVCLVTDFIDLANARIEFEDGLVANLTASRISSKHMRKIRVFQSNTYLGIDLFKKELDLYRIDSEKENFIDNKKVDFTNNDALDDELSHFIDCIIKNENPIVSVDDGIDALKLAVKIQDLINSKQSQL